MRDHFAGFFPLVSPFNTHSFSISLLFFRSWWTVNREAHQQVDVSTSLNAFSPFSGGRAGHRQRHRSTSFRILYLSLYAADMHHTAAPGPYEPCYAANFYENVCKDYYDHEDRQRSA